MTVDRFSLGQMQILDIPVNNSEIDHTSKSYHQFINTKALALIFNVDTELKCEVCIQS